MVKRRKFKATKVSAQLAAKVEPLPEPKKKAEPKKSRKIPGLLHASMAVSIEDVTARMKKSCYQCAETPETRRVLVGKGSGRYGSSQVYCIKCGTDWLEAQWVNYARAVKFLRVGKIPKRDRRTALVGEGIRDE